jgi:hypothetical protein
MSSYFIPLPRSSTILASSSSNHFNVFLADGSDRFSSSSSDRSNKEISMMAD